MSDYAIKFREKSKSKWWFATSKGTANSLRIHAARMSKEKAEQTIITGAANNPTLEFKVVNMAVDSVPARIVGKTLVFTVTNPDPFAI